jgi:predicted phosphoribosyltransferase
VTTLPFRDRRAAGQELGDLLAARFETSPPPAPVLVLGVARGGVPVAAEVARRLDAPLDTLVVRKVGAPGNPELGLGAIDARGRGVLDRDRAARMGVGEAALDEAAAAARAEAAALEHELRGDRPAPEVETQTVVVVDDGVATGGTMAACCDVLRAAGAIHVVAAAPVASDHAATVLAEAADATEFCAVPRLFMAVGEFYADFGQVCSADVRRILEAAWAAS